MNAEKQSRINSEAGKQLGEYVDAESGFVVRGAWQDDDSFGDGVRRSSWFYASALLLR